MSAEPSPVDPRARALARQALAVTAAVYIGYGLLGLLPLPADARYLALVAAFSRAVLGSSVLAIRLLPALAGALMVLLTADMVSELGGGLLAQVVAAVAIAFGPVFIGTSGLLTMDVFDIARK